MSEEIKNEVVENVAEVIEPEVAEEAVEAVQNADVDFRFAPMIVAGGVVLGAIVVGAFTLPKAFRWGKKKVNEAIEQHKAAKAAQATVMGAKIYNLEEIAAEAEKNKEEEE